MISYFIQKSCQQQKKNCGKTSEKKNLPEREKIALKSQLLIMSFRFRSHAAAPHAFSKLGRKRNFNSSAKNNKLILMN